MIVTSRTEKFYRIEMTAEQAANLQLLLENLHPSDIDAACLNGNINPGTTIHAGIIEVVDALTETLRTRK